MEWLHAIIALFSIHHSVCKASVFGYKGDKMAGGDAVCVHRRLKPGDVGVAHRTLPCGTKVVLMNPRNGKIAVATVMDHGPYGAIDDDGEWVLKRTNKDPGKWRGCLDMTRALQTLLDHNGFEKVIYAPVVERQYAASTRQRPEVQLLSGAPVCMGP